MRASSSLQEAQQRLGVANHLLGRTYPAVNDSRILLAVAKELQQALLDTTNALLEQELAAKRIPALVKDPDSRLELLQEALEHHDSDASYHAAVKEFSDLIALHQNSPVEFAKPDRFVICDKDYKVTTVTADTLKRSLATARSFIQAVERIVSEDNARITVQRQS
ncbi:hypothetical protein HY493_03970 [Candidatus Woesearchaeota archaeon]|nr:hypothetical protein [Candidatus Woesearchaeota archaeon]